MAVSDMRDDVPRGRAPVSLRSSALRFSSAAGGVLPHHCFVDGGEMGHKIRLGRDELLERRVDVVKENIGDEAIDAGIDAGWGRPVHIAAGWNEAGQHFEIGEAARVSGIRRKAADALEVIALKIELARLEQAFLREAP